MPKNKKKMVIKNKKGEGREEIRREVICYSKITYLILGNKN